MELHHLIVCFIVQSPSGGFFCYSCLPFYFRSEPKNVSLAYLLMSSREKPGKDSAELFKND